MRIMKTYCDHSKHLSCGFCLRESDARTVGEVMDDPTTIADAREAFVHNIAVRAINRGMTLGEVRQLFALREAIALRGGAR